MFVDTRNAKSNLKYFAQENTSDKRDQAYVNTHAVREFMYCTVGKAMAYRVASELVEESICESDASSSGLLSSFPASEGDLVSVETLPSARNSDTKPTGDTRRLECSAGSAPSGSGGEKALRDAVPPT